MDAIAIYGEPAVWEKLLRDQQRGLSELKPGSKIGVVPKRELAGTEGEMILWEKDTDKIVVSRQAFRGFRATDADLLFVAEEDVLAKVCNGTVSEPVRGLKDGFKQGSIILYFLKSKKDLLALGYEEFVDYLGLPLTGCQ